MCSCPVARWRRTGARGCPIKARNKRFLVPVKALAQRFRGRFLHLARRCLPRASLPHVPWSKPWVVFAKPAVQGADAVLAYLGRYVHRTAIADKAIAACARRPRQPSPTATVATKRASA